MTRRVVRTVCPRNCYCTCGMLVTVDGDRIVEITGDPENPSTQGTVCLKGLSYAERAHHPDRLASPLRRNRKGGFDPIPWEEAVEEIAFRLGGIREESGPLSVLHYEGSGSHGALSAIAGAFWNPFGGCTRAHGDLCWPAGLEATPSRTGTTGTTTLPSRGRAGSSFSGVTTLRKRTSISGG